MYLLAFCVFKSAKSTGTLALSMNDLGGALALTLEFFILRVMDEHKDYQTDLLNYPNRALQKGLVTLKQLRIMGMGAVLIQFVTSIHIDGGLGSATLAWALMTSWSFLMYKEFFCSQWLKSRLFLYALSHMCVMLFTMYWAFELCGKKDLSLNPAEVFLILNTFICGFSYEITRKARGREEERETLDSYSKILGVKGVSILMAALLGGIYAIHIGTIRSLMIEPPVADLVTVGLIAALGLLCILKYFKDTSLKTRKINESVTGLFLLANYIGIIWTTVAHHGLTLR